MKTLKRTLCLVLALVLVLGTMSMASAKSTYFADNDEINAKYAEAVEVMTALGIIDGMTDTTFVPDGTLTRAQAAKIISYVLFGDAASLIVKSETKFEDVSADHWASGYIAALTDAGVIAGMTDTTFAPEAKVTGYQWAKMLLCAMGYAGNYATGYDQIFEGQFWTANVAKYAKAAGLLDAMDDGYFLANNIAREEAVQMSFYAMLNDYAGKNTIQLVSDGKGGYIVKIVYTQIETLAKENYGLGVIEGVIADGDIIGVDQDEKDVTCDLYEDVSALACAKHDTGRHVYAWGTWNTKTEKYDQLTDVNTLDTIKDLTAADVAAFDAKIDACKTANEKDKLCNATFNFGATENGIAVFFNAALEDDTDIKDWTDIVETIDDYTSDVTGKIAFPANWTVQTYDFESDGKIDAIMVEVWEIAQVSASATSFPKNHAYYGTTKYTFGTLDGENTYTVYAPAGTYVDGGYYTVVADNAFAAYDDEFKAGQLWAENVFLKAPAALKTTTSRLNDFNVKNTDKYDAPYITFTTADGTLNESPYFIDSIYASDWYNKDLDFSAADFLKYNFKFYLDPNGEVVAYEIAETTEYVAYISDFYYVAGETTPTGHHGSTTGWTIYAHAVDLDGNVISIPVQTGRDGDPKATVDSLTGQQGKQVAYFTLQADGTYDFETYKYAKAVTISDTEKYNEGSYDYNFVSDTKTFNVAEKDTKISVTKMDIAKNYAWIVWTPVTDGDDTDYTVTNVFYDNYVAPLPVVNLFIAPGTEFDNVSADGTIHYFDVYLNGVKTRIASKQSLEDLADAFENGGFYKFEKNGDFYTIGDSIEAKEDVIEQTYAAKNLIQVGSKDYSTAGKTFVYLNGESSLEIGECLISLKGIAAGDTVFYVFNHMVP